MATSIWKCEEPRTLQLLQEVRAAYHEELAEACIVVLFREPASKSRGRVTLGSAAKASAKDRALLGEDADFLLTLSAADWHEGTERWKRALLDHELCHMTFEDIEKEDEDGEPFTERKWKLQGHDIEEFNAVLQRHGAWKEDIVRSVEILGQLELFATAQAAPELVGAAG